MVSSQDVYSSMPYWVCSNQSIPNVSDSMQILFIPYLEEIFKKLSLKYGY